MKVVAVVLSWNGREDTLACLRSLEGEDVEVARYYPEDDDYLLEREPTVTHYEVLDM